MADTIFAQATPPGRSGVAIIRISGPAALEAASALGADQLEARRASLRTLRDLATAEILDEAVAIAFPGPASFTGETVVELQCHGSPAICRAMLACLEAQPGLRPALPGEFTRRALENGRLDLAQVEGLADLLAAETDAQRRQALATAAGALSATAAAWRERLVEILALVEASIDFSDDGVDDAVLTEIPEMLASVASEMAAAVAGAGAAERIREGFVVALFGAPNVGKSTLMNALAGREVALTSSEPGTTRDALEVQLDLKGLPVTLVDTAGVREFAEGVERMGIARTRARVEAADLRILLVEREGDIHEFETHLREGDLVVRAKADLGVHRGGLAVSGRSGLGLDLLLEAVAAELQSRCGGSSGLAHVRQREAVAGALREVGVAGRLAADGGATAELAAHAVRGALYELDCLVGRVDIESVLDSVFSRFCLGK
jgi:tRNA modification GTPase